MKKKQKNSSYVFIRDKVNDLKQELELIINKEKLEKLLALIITKKGNPTRTELEKIVGSNLGAFHLANEVNKL
jgi:hypothetical protein